VVPGVLLEFPEINCPREDRLEPRVTTTEGEAVTVGNSAARAIWI
jgi:hypothetical protein